MQTFFADPMIQRLGIHPTTDSRSVGRDRLLACLTSVRSGWSGGYMECV